MSTPEEDFKISTFEIRNMRLRNVKNHAFSHKM